MELNLSDNQISNLGPLAELIGLEQLDVSVNQITDLAPIAELIALTRLDSWHNQIRNIVPLAGLASLERLDLSGNQISDLAPLADLVALKWLGLVTNQISDLTPLVGLTALTELWVGYNQIRDVAPLAGMTAVTVLALRSNQISDLAPLAGMTALAWLFLENNQITDLAPLVLNNGIGTGDYVDVRWNNLCLNCELGQDWADINVLRARGVPSLYYTPQTACWPDGSTAVFRVDPCGNVMSDASFYGSAFNLGAADLAEWVQVTESVEAGDVLELDPNLAQSCRLAQTPCSDLVAGVVSTQPGVTLGAGTLGPQQALLALSGIVPVKVTNEGGPIQPGDLLVSSSTPGYAMRWEGPEPCPCSLVGKAMEPMTDDSGTILVLLTSH
jgi:hypothetical protein